MIRRYRHETMDAWAMRLVTDPLLVGETAHSIAHLTGCDLDAIQAAHAWAAPRDLVWGEAARIAAEHDLDAAPLDVIRAALVEYELALTQSDKARCRICSKPRKPKS